MPERSTTADRAKARQRSWKTAADLLLSFDGRMRRSTAWIIVLCAAGSLMFVLTAASQLAKLGLGFSMVAGSVRVAAFLAWLWVSLAALVRRMHDRGRPSYAVLALVVPFACFWAALELGVFDGDRGRNLFGPSPKGSDRRSLPRSLYDELGEGSFL